MGESRTELLGWLNDLLALNYVKVEQCGTGGAYCQIIDSIYGALYSSYGLVFFTSLLMGQHDYAPQVTSRWHASR